MLWRILFLLLLNRTPLHNANPRLFTPHLYRFQGSYSYPLINICSRGVTNLVNNKYVIPLILHGFHLVPPNDHTPKVIDFELVLLVKYDIH